jgi:hypothetical protein
MWSLNIWYHVVVPISNRIYVPFSRNFRWRSLRFSTFFCKVSLVVLCLQVKVRRLETKDCPPFCFLFRGQWTCTCSHLFLGTASCLTGKLWTQLVKFPWTSASSLGWNIGVSTHFIAFSEYLPGSELCCYVSARCLCSSMALGFMLGIGSRLSYVLCRPSLLVNSEYIWGAGF